MTKQIVGLLSVLCLVSAFLGCDLPPEFVETVEEGILADDATIDTDVDFCEDFSGVCLESDEACTELNGEVRTDLICENDQTCCSMGTVYKLQWTCLICEKD